MSSQLMNFVSPITGPLESLQNHFTQLAALHREAHTGLRSQGEHLTGGGGIDAFVGDGAVAFSTIIEHYLNASEKHMQLLDEAASTTASCINNVVGAVGYASSSYLDEGMVAHVLGRLTHDEVILYGGSPVQAIIDDMRRMLNDMIHAGGNFFGHLFHGQIGNAFHDAGQGLGDIGQLAGDAFSLLEDVGHVLTQWAHNISDAVGNFLKTVGSLVWKVVDFVIGISSMVHDIQVIFDGKASLKDKLFAVGDLVLNAGTDVLMVTGAGELLRGGELLLKGGKAALIAELKRKGIQFSEKDLIDIIRTPGGDINWLEKGNPKKGLVHIIARHGNDFERKFRLAGQENVVKVIMDILRTQLPVDMKRDKQVFEVTINGVKGRLGVFVNELGEIITALPIRR